MSLMNALELAVLDEMLGASASLLGTPVTIGLSTTTPADDGSNITEPSGFGYARASVANDGTEWPAAAAGEKKNANTILFPAASGGSWGTLTHWVMYDSGVPKIWGVLDDGAGVPTPRLVSDGDQFRFLANNLRIAMD